MFAYKDLTKKFYEIRAHEGVKIYNFKMNTPGTNIVNNFVVAYFRNCTSAA